MTDGDLPQRDGPRRRSSDLTLAMIASGERMDFAGLGKPTADKHSTGGVGDKITLPLDAARRRLRRRGAAALRPRARPHRRHARQAGEHPGLAGEPQQRGDVRAQLQTWARAICAAGSGLAPADEQALRPARHHRHGGGDPADRLVASCRKKIAEGTARAGARREVRLRRVPARTSSARRSWPAPWWSSAAMRGSRPSRCSPT